jgi:hypothetical protein
MGHNASRHTLKGLGADASTPSTSLSVPLFAKPLRFNDPPQLHEILDGLAKVTPFFCGSGQ